MASCNFNRALQIMDFRFEVTGVEQILSLDASVANSGVRLDYVRITYACELKSVLILKFKSNSGTKTYYINTRMLKVMCRLPVTLVFFEDHDCLSRYLML